VLPAETGRPDRGGDPGAGPACLALALLGARDPVLNVELVIDGPQATSIARSSGRGPTAATNCATGSGAFT